MTHDQDAKFEAEAEQKKTVLILGMIRIIESDRMVIEKDGLSFLESNAVLFDILAVLGFIPIEAKRTHMHSVQKVIDRFNASVQGWSDAPVAAVPPPLPDSIPAADFEQTRTSPQTVGISAIEKMKSSSHSLGQCLLECGVTPAAYA